MEFEWDEAKRVINMARRGIDLARGNLVFDGRKVHTVEPPKGDETRFVTVAESDGGMIAVVWTWRGVKRRLISMRRARDEETRKYRQRHG